MRTLAVATAAAARARYGSATCPIRHGLIELSRGVMRMVPALHRTTLSQQATSCSRVFWAVMAWVQDLKFSLLQDASVEDTNSADVALGRFGREPAAYPGPERDPDELSAATAVQRWEHDNSQGKRGRAGRVARRAEGKAVKPEGLQLQRPAHPGACQATRRPLTNTTSYLFACIGPLPGSSHVLEDAGLD